MVKKNQANKNKTNIDWLGLFFILDVDFTVKPGQAYPPRIINEFIIQKLNPLLVVDFRLISAFLYA